jgi:hypothetical protein
LDGKRTEQQFGLLAVETVDAPDNLILFGRSVEHEIRDGNVSGRSNGMERRGAILVQIEIDVTNLQDAFLGPRESVGPEGVHSEKNVGATFISFPEPILKGRTGDDFPGKNPLHGLAARAVSQE